jgi:hypothetical protein
MKKKPLPHKVTELLSDLVTPIQATSILKIHDEIDSRIGPLSKPSKMPGWAWGISSTLCLTGSVLAQIQGTPCSICYALRNRYAMPNVKTAQERRLDGYEDKDWVKLMAARILLRKEPWFRWFDSGDLQHDRMLTDITQVAMLTPEISYWLPTQERAIVKRCKARPSNLVIRISSTRINAVQHSDSELTSSVGDPLIQNGVRTCPSLQQGNQCGDCRKCWDPRVKHIRYVSH